MKRLILFRHAKSGWDDPVSRDFDRPINARGRRGAELMGRWMRAEGHGFDVLISSPAVRCVETIEHFALGLGETVAPQWDKRIYLASWSGLLEVIHDAPDGAETILLCGHNPGFEDLVLALVPEGADGGLRESVGEKFPTSALAAIDFEASRWDGIAPGSGRLAWFKRPRDLDPTLGPESNA